MRKTADFTPLAGEAHPLAVLTDDEVELLRSLYGTLDSEGRVIGQKRLAMMFGVSRRAVRDWLAGRRRP